MEGGGAPDGVLGGCELERARGVGLEGRLGARGEFVAVLGGPFAHEGRAGVEPGGDGREEAAASVEAGGEAEELGAQQASSSQWARGARRAGLPMVVMRLTEADVYVTVDCRASRWRRRAGR